MGFGLGFGFVRFGLEVYGAGFGIDIGIIDGGLQRTGHTLWGYNWLLVAFHFASHIVLLH